MNDLRTLKRLALQRERVAAAGVVVVSGRAIERCSRCLGASDRVRWLRNGSGVLCTRCFNALAGRERENFLPKGKRFHPDFGCVDEFAGLVPRSCPICGAIGPDSRHHLKPKAKHGNGPTILLCRACHDRAHEVFGPGDDYRGPFDPLRFVAAMTRTEAARG